MNHRGDEYIIGLLLLLLIAVCQDYRQDKIKNGLVMSMLLWGLYLQIAGCGGRGIWLFLTGSCLTFFLTYPLFQIGALGAGDVKLFTACAGALGIKRGLLFLCCTFLTAAVLSLRKMLYQHTLFQRFRYFFTYIRQAVLMAQIIVYEWDDTKKKERRIHLAGPAFFAMLLGLGGMY